MISSLTGKVGHLSEEKVNILLDGIAYEVLVPRGVARELASRKTQKGEEKVTLFTYHYLEGSPMGSLIPRLVGFLSELERDFLIHLLNVRGMGVKTALKALSSPVGVIARAVEQKDVEALHALPGIGKKLAEQMVIELKGKVGKFALMQEGPQQVEGKEVALSLREEALECLLQLGYNKPEAEAMLRKAMARDKVFPSTEELLQEVFKTRGQLGKSK